MKVDYSLFDGETDLTIAAPCGLYCGSCGIFRTYFDRNRRKAEEYSRAMKCKPGDIKCSGCRVDGAFCWSTNCHFKECTGKRGIGFCYECKDFPCEKLDEFAESAPHHRDIIANLERMKIVGWRKWLSEQDEKWRCEVCRAKLEYYDVSCPVCDTPKA